MEILSYWVELVHANVKYPTVEIIGLVVAVGGFLLPWRSAYNKHIDVYWGEHQIIDCSFRPGDTCCPQKAFMVSLQIVNTSNIDMGYFDLCAVATDGKEYNMLFKDTYHGNAQKFYRIHESGGPIMVCAPPAPTGAFPANTSTIFHLLVTRSPVMEQVSSEIILMFRTTERPIKKKLNPLFYGLKKKKDEICFALSSTSEPLRNRLKIIFSGIEMLEYHRYKEYKKIYILDKLFKDALDAYKPKAKAFPASENN